MTGRVHLDVEGHVAVITLDNPPLNIVTDAMRPLMQARLREAADNPAVRCVVITGAGSRAFCAGADLAEEADLTPETVRRFIEVGKQQFDDVENFPVPVIAAVNGHCMGGGFELALSCDIRIVSETAKLRGAGVTVGLVVSTTRLTRLAGPAVAKELLLTGRTFDGRDAYRLGLASAVVPGPEVLPRAREWAEEIATRAPLAVRRTKTSIHEASALPYEEAMSRELDHFAALSATEDHKEAIRAFFARTPPRFRGR